MALTVQLARIMLPTLTFHRAGRGADGDAQLAASFLHPRGLPGHVQTWFTIICAFALVPLMPGFGLHPIAAIAIGTLLGGVAQLALQWQTLRREGFRYRQWSTCTTKDCGVSWS